MARIGLVPAGKRDEIGAIDRGETTGLESGRYELTATMPGAEGALHNNIGKPDYNMTLSEARAGAVKAWLVSHDVSADRVTSRGYGDTRPLVPNDTDADRFKNRRVELRRMNCH
ncbi:MAG: OmpA family protein [Rhizomicrobium sp.]